jgi:hypothetical protein
MFGLGRLGVSKLDRKIVRDQRDLHQTLPRVARGCTGFLIIGLHAGWKVAFALIGKRRLDESLFRHRFLASKHKTMLYVQAY